MYILTVKNVNNVKILDCYCPVILIPYSFLEENSVRVQLDISSAIHTKIFEQMRAIYPRYDLPKVVEEICHQCVQIARKQTREALEEEIDNAYNDLRTNLSSSDKNC